jgi:hypothetical protein
LKNTADRHDKPNNVYGWGLINAYDAALYFGMFISNKPEVKLSGDGLSFSIFAISKDQIDPASVTVNYALDGEQDFKQITMELAEKTGEGNSGKYSVTLPADLKYDVLKFYFTASDSKKSVTGPHDAPKRFFILNKGSVRPEIY